MVVSILTVVLSIVDIETDVNYSDRHSFLLITLVPHFSSLLHRFGKTLYRGPPLFFVNVGIYI